MMGVAAIQALGEPVNTKGLSELTADELEIGELDTNATLSVKLEL